MKRLITEKQERILKACHHDFEGLPQTEAAKKLGISQAAISDALARIEKVMPQMFPILTRLEAERHHLYCAEGWSVEEIAERFGVTPDSVYKALQRAKDKGACFVEPKGRMLSYEPSMDGEIKERF